jgi:hypothetical protein
MYGENVRYHLPVVNGWAGSGLDDDSSAAKAPGPTSAVHNRQGKPARPSK